MNMLSKRQYSLIQILNTNSSPVSGTILAQRLNVSPRTLRYDIKKINESLNATVILSNKNGYYVNKHSELSQFIDVQIENEDIIQQKIMLTLMQNETNNIYDLEEKYYYSPSTLWNCIKNSTPTLQENHIQIVKSGDNIYSYASEENRRKMLTEFFFYEVNNVGSKLQNHKEFFTYFELDEIKEIVDLCLEELHYKPDNIYMSNIIVRLAVCIQRILDKHFIDEASLQNNCHENMMEHQFIKKFVEKINTKFHIHIPDTEINYLTFAIHGCFFETDQLPNHKFSEKIKHILNQTSQHFSLDVSYDDIFERLSRHIYYLIKRAQYSGLYEIDFSHQFRYGHPFLYEIAVYLTFLLEKEFHVQIQSGEISLLTFYLGLVIDDTIMYDWAKVICVCPQYHALREKVLRQIHDNFYPKIEIVDCVSSYTEIKPNEKYDFIISTSKSEAIINDSLYVNPYITPRELHFIEKKIQQVFQMKKIKKIYQDLFLKFDPQFFYYNNELVEDKDILNMINKQLIDKHIVNEYFMDDLIQRERKSSTRYLNQFAIGHSLNIKGTEDKIVYYYNDEKINWFGHHINLLIIIITKDFGETFANTYSLLYDVLLDARFYNQLTSFHTYEELRNEFLKDYKE